MKNPLKKTNFNQEFTKVYFVEYKLRYFHSLKYSYYSYGYDPSAASSSDRHYRGEYSECTDPEEYDPTPVPENFGREDIEYADSDEKEDCLEDETMMREFMRRINGRQKEKRWKRNKNPRRFFMDYVEQDEEDNGTDSEEEEYNKWVEKKFGKKEEDDKSDDEGQGKIQEEKDDASLEKSLAKTSI